MNSNELEMQKEAIKEGIKQFFEPYQDLLRQLLGPAASEIGLAWGDSTRLWRAKRYARLMEEFQRFVSERKLKL